MNIQNNQAKNTALEIARNNEDLKSLEILLNNGADANILDHNGDSLLMFAAKRGLNDLVETLLKNGANINLVNNENKGALHFAKNEEKISTLEIFVNNGADANMPNHNGDTLLMFAAKQGLDNLIEVLLKNRADINSINKEGETALSLATKFSQHNAIKTLSVDVNYLSDMDIVRNKETISDCIKQTSNNTSCHKLLLNNEIIEFFAKPIHDIELINAQIDAAKKNSKPEGDDVKPNGDCKWLTELQTNDDDSSGLESQSHSDQKCIDQLAELDIKLQQYEEENSLKLFQDDYEEWVENNEEKETTVDNWANFIFAGVTTAATIAAVINTSKRLSSTESDSIFHSFLKNPFKLFSASNSIIEKAIDSKVDSEILSDSINNAITKAINDAIVKAIGDTLINADEPATPVTVAQKSKAEDRAAEEKEGNQLPNEAPLQAHFTFEGVAESLLSEKNGDFGVTGGISAFDLVSYE